MSRLCPDYVPLYPWWLLTDFRPISVGIKMLLTDLRPISVGINMLLTDLRPISVEIN